MERNAWLVRNTVYCHDYNLTKEFLENSYIGFGPNGFGSLQGSSLQDMKQIFSDSIFGENKDFVAAVAADADRFVNKMREMDLALLVDGDDIYTLEIMSDYYFDEDNESCIFGWPHRRAVRQMRRINRNALSLELRKALKSKRKIADLSKFFEEIYALTYGEELPKEKKEQEPVKVEYPLRPNFKIDFEIPADMTRNEASRLAKFLETLYFK